MSETKRDEFDFSHLTPAQYAVLREAATEPAFSGEYVYTTDDGIYRCAACHARLFDSNAKFFSECGWPSFSESAEKDDDDPIEYRRDTSHGMTRTEVVCKQCKSHLGHVFDDGPAPTGLRYCINSLAIDLDRSSKE